MSNTHLHSIVFFTKVNWPRLKTIRHLKCSQYFLHITDRQGLYPEGPVYTYRPRVRQSHHQSLTLCQWWWTFDGQIGFRTHSVCQCKFDGGCDGDGDRDVTCKRTLSAATVTTPDSFVLKYTMRYVVSRFLYPFLILLLCIHKVLDTKRSYSYDTALACKRTKFRPLFR